MIIWLFDPCEIVLNEENVLHVCVEKPQGR